MDKKMRAEVLDNEMKSINTSFIELCKVIHKCRPSSSDEAVRAITHINTYVAGFMARIDDVLEQHTTRQFSTQAAKTLALYVTGLFILASGNAEFMPKVVSNRISVKAPESDQETVRIDTVTDPNQILFSKIQSWAQAYLALQQKRL